MQVRLQFLILFVIFIMYQKESREAIQVKPLASMGTHSNCSPLKIDLRRLNEFVWIPLFCMPRLIVKVVRFLFNRFD
jgi:hypothetical protein